MQPSLR